MGASTSLVLFQVLIECSVAVVGFVINRTRMLLTGAAQIRISEAAASAFVSSGPSLDALLFYNDPAVSAAFFLLACSFSR